MKIAIIGASGKQGQFLVREALSRGHAVTAIVRDKTKLTEPGVQILEKEVFALRYDDLEDYDAIIDTLGFWTPETMPLHQTSVQHLADLLAGTPHRLVVVGGAGSLYVDAGLTLRLMDAPGFPEEYKAVAAATALGFEALRERQDVRWTYLCPPAVFDPQGPRTGRYHTGGDVLLTNTTGESRISYADYAVAMIDEVEQGNHIQRRFTVVAD